MQERMALDEAGAPDGTAIDKRVGEDTLGTSYLHRPQGEAILWHP